MPVETPAWAGRWRVERRHAAASDVHAADPVEPVAPVVWIVDVPRPALVLGSAQGRRRAEVDERVARLGLDVEVVVRRSGGGAVYVAPGAQVWVDVIVPTGDDVWRTDVGRAFDWLGAVWAEAITAVVPSGSRPTIGVHSGPLRGSSWSDTVCFAGLGPGEITIDGRKAVGVSQRRTRSHSRFQCMALLRWSPDVWIDGLVAAGERADAVAALEPAAGPVETGSAGLTTAFLRAIAAR